MSVYAERTAANIAARDSHFVEFLTEILSVTPPPTSGSGEPTKLSFSAFLPTVQEEPEQETKGQEAQEDQVEEDRDPLFTYRAALPTKITAQDLYQSDTSEVDELLDGS